MAIEYSDMVAQPAPVETFSVVDELENQGRLGISGIDLCQDTKQVLQYLHEKNLDLKLALCPEENEAVNVIDYVPHDHMCPPDGKGNLPRKKLQILGTY